MHRSDTWSPSGPNHEVQSRIPGSREPRPPHVMKVVRGEVLGEFSGILFWSHVDVKLAFIPCSGEPTLTPGGLGTCCHLDADRPRASV